LLLRNVEFWEVEKSLRHLRCFIKMGKRGEDTQDGGSWNRREPPTPLNGFGRYNPGIWPPPLAYRDYDGSGEFE
jgi:hypothetical protein